MSNNGLKLAAAALAGAGGVYAYMTGFANPLHTSPTAASKASSSPSSSSRSVAAICLLAPDNNSGVKGVVRFRQPSEGEAVTITARIEGLKDGLHGFHIHEFGNLSQGCITAGAHFNPLGKTHGGMSDTERHVGDMGNVESRRGVAELTAVDSLRLIQLSGDNSVIGRSVIVHADPDDLGKGGFDDSKTTGHAGARLACGVIGVDKA